MFTHSLQSSRGHGDKEHQQWSKDERVFQWRDADRILPVRDLLSSVAVSLA